MATVLASAANATTCPLTGNSDLYGLGIRVGIYIQMLTVQLSGLASQALRIEDNLGQATIIFVLATGIALIREINLNQVEAVEVYPILTLLLAQVGVCRVPYWKNQTTAFIYMVEIGGIFSMFLWFWWHGMDGLPNSCHLDKAFFFAKVSIWHWFRTLNKVSSVLFAITGGISVIFYFVAICCFAGFRIARYLEKKMNNIKNPISIPDDEYQKAFAPVDFLVNIGAIVYVEMGLKWNHIAGVHSLSSAGQFMPFFISIAQLFGVFYGVAKFGLDVANDEIPSEEDEDDEELECLHKGGDASEESHPLTPVPSTDRHKSLLPFGQTSNP